MIGHLDLMLAELMLGDEQVKLVEQAKLKYTCASLMIDKGLYQDAFVMESEGALDAAEVIEYIGLTDTANKLREMHSDI
jgi:hypothetical protein